MVGSQAEKTGPMPMGDEVPRVRRGVLPSSVGPPRLSGLWQASFGVTAFNRFSRLVESLARRLVYALCTLYFNDANIADWCSSKGSGQWALNKLNKLLGTRFAAEKHQPMALDGTFLGLDHHLGHRRSCSALGSRALAGEAGPSMPG